MKPWATKGRASLVEQEYSICDEIEYSSSVHDCIKVMHIIKDITIEPKDLLCYP